MLLSRNAHPAVANRARRGGKLARQTANRFCRNAGDGGRLLSAVSPDSRRGLAEAIAKGFEPARPDQTFLDEGRQKRQQESQIGTGPDKKMLVRNLGRLGPAGIDDGQPAAALLQGFEPRRHAWHGHHAAIGDKGVRPKHQEEVRVVDVRDRDCQLVPVHPQANKLVGQLVGRRCRIPVFRFDLPENRAGMGHQPPIMNIGVAVEGGHRVESMAGGRLGDTIRGALDSLVPRNRLPAAANTAHWRAQPVWVVLNVLKRHSLRADVPPAEWIVRIALDR